MLLEPPIVSSLKGVHCTSFVAHGGATAYNTTLCIFPLQALLASISPGALQPSLQHTSSKGPHHSRPSALPNIHHSSRLLLQALQNKPVIRGPNSSHPCPSKLSKVTKEAKGLDVPILPPS